VRTSRRPTSWFLFLLATGLLAAAVVAPAASSAAVGSTAGSAASTSAGVAAQATGAAATANARRMPSEVPSPRTPGVGDGEVQKIVQVGDMMVAGGQFSVVTGPGGSPTHDRSNLFAFDAATGAVSAGFDPRLNGPVAALLPGPRPGTVYVAGAFTSVNGTPVPHIALLRLSDGQLVRGFAPVRVNGAVETLARDGDRLYLGGFFTKAGGQPHGGMASIDATTGELDPFLDVALAGHHNDTGSGAQGAVGAREMVLTPAGDRLAVVGNFKTADGLPRDQLVMLSLDGADAEVTPGWATTRYSPYCSSFANDSYMRGIAMSPDGSWFVVTATGGGNDGTLCDSAARWETYATGSDLQPTWSAESGGDTLWGVGITEAAVYVGGHQRWMNNPDGTDGSAPGAVPRPGLAALDPATGVPLDWNPGRNPRGEAAYALYPTDRGVWVTSNTKWIGNREFRRDRIAFFPYAGGYTIAPTDTGSLPTDIVVGGSAETDPNVLYRVNAGGSTLRSIDAGPDWIADNTADSANRNSGSENTVWMNPATPNATVPAGTPEELFRSERYDPSGGTDMHWAFPVPAGEQVQVRLFFGNRCSCTMEPGQRVFDVSVDGSLVLDDYDIVGDVGHSVGTMKAFPVTSDGSIDIDFGHVVENPTVSGIEIVGTGVTQPTDESARSIAFDGSAASSQTIDTTGFDWSKVRGAVMIHDTVFYGTADGALHKRSFDGERFGVPSDVDPYFDPAWSGVSAGNGWTYTGEPPTFFRQLDGVTGMFYAAGRLYYTKVDDDALYSSAFSPDSGVLSPVVETQTGFEWSFVRGMFLDDDDLYVVWSPDGSLLRLSFDDGAVSGPATIVNGPPTGGIDWRGRAVFMSTLGQGASPGISYVGSAAQRGASTIPKVDVPESVRTNDRLVLALSRTNARAIVHRPVGVEGWTRLGVERAKSLRTVFWTKRASAGDAGSTVAVPLSHASKYTMTIAAYRGAGGTPTAKSAAITSIRKARTTPSVRAPARAWVLSYWADRSGSTTRWWAGLRAHELRARCGRGLAHPCSLLADSGKPVRAALHAGVRAHTNRPSPLATVWSIVLRAG
jgi:hypothetical protein